jgi:hypothetical protein
MKHIADIQPGGFIVDNEYHLSIGEMINQRDAAIIALAGDKAIISGVLVAGASHTAGVVTYNGKLYSFAAGTTQATVTIKKVALDRPNANQVDAPAFYEDIIEFGNDGFATFNFSDLKRYYVNQPRSKEIKILGENITNAQLAGTGWFLANGANGTDDLLNRFFVVAGNEYSVGNTGGSKQVTLTEAQMPSHSHNVTVEFNDGTGIAGDGDQNSGSHSISTDSKGGDQAHENRPPYYAVVAIQFIGV